MLHYSNVKDIQGKGPEANVEESYILFLLREVRSTSLSFENIEAERDYILRFKMGGLCAGGLSLLSFLLLAKGSWILQTSML